ncbi:hypothetical protein EJ110_NYTH16029 [Nymphaea thermarum]|nr:hypothetical protein EJ110_NYTH16029 [Nymphaea thermarum]
MADGGAAGGRRTFSLTHTFFYLIGTALLPDPSHSLSPLLIYCRFLSVPASQVLSRLLSFFLNLLIARRLTQEDYAVMIVLVTFCISVLFSVSPAAATVITIPAKCHRSVDIIVELIRY